jgi:serine/threonine-protein kinase
MESLKKSLVLAPQDMGALIGIAECYWYLRDYDEALTYAKRVLEFYPDEAVSYWYVGMIYRLKGDLETAQKVMDAYDGDNRTYFPYFRSLQYYMARDFDRAIDALSDVERTVYSDEGRILPRSLLVGLVRVAKGDTAAARSDFEAALDTLATLVKQRPDDHRLYSAIGLCQAGLGQAEAAVANGRKSAEMYPLSKDRYAGTWRLNVLAQIYALAGWNEEAIAQLDELLSIPSLVSTATIRLNPMYDGLRDDPRYRKMMQKHDPNA